MKSNFKKLIYLVILTGVISLIHYMLSNDETIEIWKSSFFMCYGAFFYYLIISDDKNQEKEYSRKDLVKFGNFLLSEKRRGSVKEINKNNVTHADLENWMYGDK
jgi:hypothetical protein